MTDKEIIKGLECCKDNNEDVFSCEKCPYHGAYECCVNELCRDALALINRQKAEIKKLRFEAAKLLPKDCPYAVQVEVSNKLEAQIKSEAVKEFATRLEEYSYESMGNYGISRMVVSVKDIDNLVKEMEKKYEIS